MARPETTTGIPPRQSRRSKIGGLRCPKCLCLTSQVIDSRPYEDHALIRRRRVCRNCLHRWTTREINDRAEINPDFLRREFNTLLDDIASLVARYREALDDVQLLTDS